MDSSLSLRQDLRPRRHSLRACSIALWSTGKLNEGAIPVDCVAISTGATSHQDFFSGFKTEFPPYKHQGESWKRLRSSDSSKSTLIATGTGSGKTECFMYPLLEHCLQQHAAGQIRGIKAIVIYPMNALAPLVNLRMQLWVRELRRIVTSLRQGIDDAGNPVPVTLSFADDQKQTIFLVILLHLLSGMHLI